MNNSYIGLKIGAIFTLISLLLTITFVVPAFSMLPGAVIESIAKIFVKNNPSNLAKLTLVILASIFVLLIIATVIYTKKQGNKKNGLSKMEIISIMLIFWLIVHPLVFLVYLGVDCDNCSDGQVIMESIRTFPISSLIFIMIGAIIDIVEN